MKHTKTTEIDMGHFEGDHEGQVIERGLDLGGCYLWELLPEEARSTGLDCSGPWGRFKITIEYEPSGDGGERGQPNPNNRTDND